MAELTLYNSLTRQKEPFTPLDEQNIRLYACGPTVYDRPHLGNARAVVVYDVLFRLLKALYGDEHVTYVRNITDVDDKINKAAKENGESIQQLTSRITDFFHADMDALNCKRPTYEPRATEFVNITQNDQKESMVAMITRLIDQGHAYATSDGHVMFDVTSYEDYGQLSGRTLEEQQAGARIAVEDYKKNPGDFVLWKPASADDDPSSIFDSPWSQGRPGWHIECSVMSTNFLGESYDIHGGGADLKFPHHENEIAQACCANHGSSYAKYWVHNGFLTVEGEKMSKSLGNFTTVRELLDQGIKGEVIRYVFLSTHYRKPLDWNTKSCEDAMKNLDKFYATSKAPIYMSDAAVQSNARITEPGLEAARARMSDNQYYTKFLQELCNDMNVPAGLAALHKMLSFSTDAEDNCDRMVAYEQATEILGISSYVSDKYTIEKTPLAVPSEIKERVAARTQAKKNRDFAKADQIRDELLAEGYEIVDKRDGDPEVRRIS